MATSPSDATPPTPGARPDPADERRHPPDDERLWNESWYFDFVADDGRLGGYVRIGLYPNLGRVWYWACVTEEGGPLVTVIDHEVPLPRGDASLELRSTGLWADHVCEEPLDRWSLGLEAFGVSLDDPAETYRGLRGEQTPLGFDLEWETDGGAYLYPPVLARYEVPCKVHGEILRGGDRFEFDGHGQRDHSWGVRDWWALGWCWVAGRLEDGSRFHASRPRLEGLDWFTGYRKDPAGPLVDLTTFSVVEELGPEGIPTAARLTVDELAIDVEPVAWSPVLLVDEYEARTSRFPRGMCRLQTSDGRTGTAWIEFNQPQ